MSERNAYDRAKPFVARWLERPTLALPLPPGLRRAIFELHARMNSRANPLPVEWREVAGVRTRVTRPEGATRRLLYVHGGGFVIGSPTTHAAMTDRLAELTGFEVWSPDYRLAPEHPFPAAPDDVEAVARAMRPDHVAGDSAGGALALVALQALLADGTPPSGATLISPVVDMDAARLDGRSGDMLLPRRFLAHCHAAFCPACDPRDPRLSPIHGDYAGAPPTHIELSSGEVLEEDGLAIAETLRAAGAPVTIHAEPGMPHVHHLAAGRSRVAEAGLARIAAHVVATA